MKMTRPNGSQTSGTQHPSPIIRALLIWIPIGLVCLFMLIRFGPGSGFGLWILGITLAIANMLYAILQRRKVLR